MFLLPGCRARRRFAGSLILLALVWQGCDRRTTATPAMPAPQLRIPQSVETPDQPAQGHIAPVDWTTHPWTPEKPSRDWEYLVIHHTASKRGDVESIHRAHLARTDANGNPWRGIGYHFVIGNGQGMPDGQVEPTFRWRDQIAGAHAGNALYNQQGIGVCLVGDFEKHVPTLAQLQSLASLTECLCSAYDIPLRNIKRHRDIKSTACPGRNFSMREFTRLLERESPSEDGTTASTP